MITISNLKLNSFSEQLDFSDYDMIVVTDIADLLQPLFANLQFYQEELFLKITLRLYIINTLWP